MDNAQNCDTYKKPNACSLSNAFTSRQDYENLSRLSNKGPVWGADDTLPSAAKLSMNDLGTQRRTGSNPTMVFTAIFPELICDVVHTLQWTASLHMKYCAIAWGSHIV
jgi:hypothetical protein